MTTNTPAVEVQTPAPVAPRENYLNCSRGFKSWALTLDHKRIGLMYLIGTSIAFLAGGVFALLVRLHLWEPEGMIFSNPTYNQIFTLHGAFMVFLFVIPAIPASLGNVVMPLMLGAKDVALPKVNLLSFYLWVIGAVLAVLAIVLGRSARAFRACLMVCFCIWIVLDFMGKSLSLRTWRTWLLAAYCVWSDPGMGYAMRLHWGLQPPAAYST